MSRRVRGFAEGLAGQAFALVAGLAVAFALGNFVADYGAILLPVVLAPWLLGAGVPVHRHGLVAAAGVATGWLVVFTAVLLVALTTNDAVLAEGLGYALISWMLVLLVEAIAVAGTMRDRHGDTSPPPSIRVADIRELDAKFKPPDSRE